MCSASSVRLPPAAKVELVPTEVETVGVTVAVATDTPSDAPADRPTLYALASACASERDFSSALPVTATSELEPMLAASEGSIVTMATEPFNVRVNPALTPIDWGSAWTTEVATTCKPPTDSPLT